jgi:hypothetical protein
LRGVTSWSISLRRWRGSRWHGLRAIITAAAARQQGRGLLTNKGRSRHETPFIASIVLSEDGYERGEAVAARFMSCQILVDTVLGLR